MIPAIATALRGRRSPDPPCSARARRRRASSPAPRPRPAVPRCPARPGSRGRTRGGAAPSRASRSSWRRRRSRPGACPPRVKRACTRRGRADGTPRITRRQVPRATLGSSISTVDRRPALPVALGHGVSRHGQRHARGGRRLPGDAQDRQQVGAVGLDLDIEDDLVQAEEPASRRPADGGAGRESGCRRGRRSRARAASRSSLQRLAAQRPGARAPARPGRAPPGGAYGTRSPTSQFATPAATRARPPFGPVSSRRQGEMVGVRMRPLVRHPATITPSSPSHGRSTPSTWTPCRREPVGRARSTSRSVGQCSRSQLRGILIAPPEPRQEAHVAVEQHADVGDREPRHRQPVVAAPECEPRVALGVVAHARAGRWGGPCRPPSFDPSVPRRRGIRRRRTRSTRPRPAPRARRTGRTTA